MPKDKRPKRDLHAFNEDGMVLCNPRDKEAAHRAEVEGIATDDCNAVTCRKCLSLLHKRAKAEDSTLEPNPAAKYSPKEGQYLAFIYYYTKLHQQAPAELDMQKYSRVTPPSVHDMVMKLEKHGFIAKEPGVPRSIRLLLSREELPDLE